MGWGGRGQKYSRVRWSDRESERVRESIKDRRLRAKVRAGRH